MEKKIKYICNAVKWFDKVNGNTYHSVRITRVKDNKTIVNQHDYVYGYDGQYQQTALETMLENGWLPKKYNKDNIWEYERLNKYSIYWNCKTGLKRDMIANGKI